MTSTSAAARTLAALRALAAARATPAGDHDLAALAAWSGWGPVAAALNPLPKPEWAETAAELDELLTAAELNAARDASDTSFYTPDAIVDAMFAILREAGLESGAVFEPGCGSGSIIARTPAWADYRWIGVERDPTAAEIAAVRNPEANIINARLEHHHLAAESMDAVIANVPFGKSAPYDPDCFATSLHGYFIRRALDALRPGGLAVVLTSRYFIDSIKTPDEWAAFDAELVGAVRLPSGTFDGTDVVADLLVLRKPDGQDVQAWELPTATAAGSWGTTRQIVASSDLGDGTRVSGLWALHPEAVAGVQEPTGYDPAPLRVVGTASDVAEAVAALLPSIPLIPEITADTFEDVKLESHDGIKEGSFFIEPDTSVVRIDGGKRVPVRATRELRALIELRDAAVELVEHESDADLPDDAITPLRERAAALYRDYVAAFGPLGRGTMHEGKPDRDTGEPTYTWRRPALGGFRRDPDYPVVLALEHFDQDTGEASPAAILERRVNHALAPRERADSLEEALSITLGESLTIDLARIAELTGTDQDTVRQQLIERQAALADPVTGELIDADRYLSGNVREKMAAAAGVGAGANLAALEAVLPTQLGPQDIRPQLGAPWITAKDVRLFASEVLGAPIDVAYQEALGDWSVDLPTYSKYDPAAAAAYGTRHFTPGQILAHALRGKQPVAYREDWDGRRYRKVRDQAGTIAAEEALSQMQRRFSVWVWEERDRSECICAEYNRRFRSHVPRRSTGSTHLTFPGLADSVSLWDNQKSGVWRALTTDRVIVNHVVGGGKTLTAICSAVKLRQLGIVNKPLLVVPNHLLEQIAREARTAYPTGRFLIAGKDDLAKDARRVFAARCATGDWDAVVMTHSAFTSIGLDPAVEVAWIEEEKATLRNAIAAGGGSAKDAARSIRSMEARIEKLRDKPADPQQITFEQLGVDWIGVDELHYFRRLSVNSASSRNGFSLGQSIRATDLLLKVRYLADLNPGRPVFAGYTGTLLSNTLAEVFVWQTFVQPQRLREAGVSGFDAWAATFVKFELAVEVKPEGGGFHLKRRPSSIHNAPELAAMLSENCDTLTREQIGLDVPDSRFVDCVSDMSDEQEAILADLATRADRIRSGAVSQDEDNMLAVCGVGRSAALDPALVEGFSGTSPKLVRAAAEIARIWRERRDDTHPGSATPGALQLVLCDLGTPHSGTEARTYGRLRALLVQQGIPARQVRFVHEATTDKARAALFAQCRSGEVAVLFGSTAKVGTGTNIQTRLVALHHLDAPWMPSGIEQREGRGIRPGNLYPEVSIYRYIVEGTFDAMVWETLQRKAKFIAAFMSANADQREVEDVTGVVLSFGQVKALATGRPELLRHAELSSEASRLRIARAVWGQQVQQARHEATGLRQQAYTAERWAKQASELELSRQQQPVSGVGRAVESLMGEPSAYRNTRTTHWGGLQLTVRHDRERREISVELRSVSYFDLADAVVPRKVARKGASAIDQWVNQWASDWIEGVSRQVADRISRSVEYTSRADQLEAFADAAVFDREAELSAIEAELGAIERDLELSAAAEPVLV